MSTSTTTNAFANLFRNSRLATYDRTLNQVYTTTRNFKKIGEWGLKRNLPTVIRTDYTTIKDLDTAEHQTPWYSANNQVLFMKRWKENFGTNFSQKPKPAVFMEEEKDLQNVMAMTPGQFKHFLKQCAKRAPELKQLIKSKQLLPEQIYEYLRVTFEQTRPTVGPTYSHHTPVSQAPQEPIKVQGRILNPVKADYFVGHAVAIGGVVGLLPREYTSHIQNNKNDRHILHDFYVESITVTEDGSPLIILSHRPPNSIDSLTSYTTTYHPSSSLPFVTTDKDHAPSSEATSLPQQQNQNVHETDSNHPINDNLFLTKGATKESEGVDRQRANAILRKISDLLNDRNQ